MKNKSLAIICLLALAGALLGACGGTDTRRATGEYIDDTAVNARVKTALLRDDVVGGFDVSTTTYDRVVQLSGFVNTEEERQRAEEVASEVDGVERVENNISLSDREVEYGESPRNGEAREDEEEPFDQDRERQSPEETQRLDR